MDERLTQQEIYDKFPEQWLGLTDVEWADESNIKSAIVAYPNISKEKALDLMFKTHREVVAISTKRIGKSVGIIG